MRSISWVFSILAAIILLQTLFFKFSGAEESVYIFQTLQVEPWGRFGSAVLELAASILILWPRSRWMGAFLSLGIISGAILSHIFVLGIEIRGDHGLLFGLAIGVFISSAIVLLAERKTIPFFKK